MFFPLPIIVYVESNVVHFNSLYIYYILKISSLAIHTKRQFGELDKQLYYIIIKKKRGKAIVDMI